MRIRFLGKGGFFCDFFGFICKFKKPDIQKIERGKAAAQEYRTYSQNFERSRSPLFLQQTIMLILPIELVMNRPVSDYIDVLFVTNSREFGTGRSLPSDGLLRSNSVLLP